MKELLLIVFLVTLFYMSIANRMRGYIQVLSIQGVLMFLVAFFQLHEVSAFNLFWILLETIIFKSVAVPYFLTTIIKHNKITRESEPYLPAIVVGTIILASMIKDEHLDKIFFVAAVSAIFFGLYFISSRRKLLSHVMGYVVIENGVFILSLAVGNEMPMLVNLGVLLDIFASVLILGIFVNKIGDVFKDADVDNLTLLKD